MSDLIASLEAAEEGSRELDYEIGFEIGFDDMVGAKLNPYLTRTPKWTTSLDAALQLLPPGFMLRKLAEFPDGWSATIVDGAKSFDGQSLTSARLAVCIACLKARETEVPA